LKTWEVQWVFIAGSSMLQAALAGFCAVIQGATRGSRPFAPGQEAEVVPPPPPPPPAGEAPAAEQIGGARYELIGTLRAILPSGKIVDLNLYTRSPAELDGIEADASDHLTFVDKHELYDLLPYVKNRGRDLITTSKHILPLTMMPRCAPDKDKVPLLAAATLINSWSEAARIADENADDDDAQSRQKDLASLARIILSNVLNCHGSFRTCGRTSFSQQSVRWSVLDCVGRSATKPETGGQRRRG